MVLEDVGVVWQPLFMAHDGAPGTGGKEEGAPLILGLAVNLPLTKSAVLTGCPAVLLNIVKPNPNTMQ